MLTDYITPDQRLVACPNQDVVYGAGALALDITPVVIQVPDFGGRFWVYQVVDLRTDGVVQLGKMYGTTLGFYIVVGPDWHAETPKGITKVFRSGGLTAREIIRGVRIAVRDGFAGFDLVEVSPDFDSASGTTSILAARLLAEALFSLAAHRAGRPDCWRSAHLNVLTADAAPSPQQP
jgi:hypothetical protein